MFSSENKSTNGRVLQKRRTTNNTISTADQTPIQGYDHSKSIKPHNFPGPGLEPLVNSSASAYYPNANYSPPSTSPAHPLASPPPTTDFYNTARRQSSTQDGYFPPPTTTHNHQNSHVHYSVPSRRSSLASASGTIIASGEDSNNASSSVGELGDRRNLTLQNGRRMSGHQQGSGGDVGGNAQLQREGQQQPLHSMPASVELLKVSKFYSQGFLLRRLLITPEGKPASSSSRSKSVFESVSLIAFMLCSVQTDPNSVEGRWAKWFVQLSGTIMSTWNAAEMEAAAKENRTVRPTTSTLPFTLKKLTKPTTFCRFHLNT